MQVLVRDNNVDQALRVLKKKLQREGVFREMKARSAYEKPSESALAKRARRSAARGSLPVSRLSAKACCRRRRRKSWRELADVYRLLEPRLLKWRKHDQDERQSVQA